MDPGQERMVLLTHRPGLHDDEHDVLLHEPAVRDGSGEILVEAEGRPLLPDEGRRMSNHDVDDRIDV